MIQLKLPKIVLLIALVFCSFVQSVFVFGMTTFSRFIPIYNPLDTECFTVISSGVHHNVAIKNDGTLWAWGRNDFGQLGDGTIIVKNTPVQIGMDNNWSMVSCGNHHTVAIKIDGTIWAWGWNIYGQLGDNTITNKNMPVQIGTDTNWAAVEAGNISSAALKNDGTRWAWGFNETGEFGNGSFTSTYTPLQIGSDTNWLKIIPANYFTLAIKTDGTLWAWGWNSYGQLGDGTNINKNTPIQVGVDNDWETATISAYSHVVAIKTNGTLWGWGRNNEGQLGIGNLTNINQPTQIGLDSNWKDIVAGLQHSVGVKTDGTLWTWGWNAYGQLGDGTNISKTVPIQIGTDTNWDNIGDVSGNHSVCFKTDGSFYLWGLNSYGQLGDGTFMSQNTSIEIDCPNSLSINDLQYELGMIQVFPNPVKGVLNINSVEKIMQIDIIDVSGRVIQSIEIDFENEFNLDVSHLSAGNYFLKLESENGIAIKKFIKI